MPIQHTSPKQKWELLFNTIGAKKVEITNITDTHITIKVDPNNLLYLRTLLEYKDELKRNTLHALLCNTQTANKKPLISSYNASDIVNVKDNNWLRKVLSDDFIKQNNLSRAFDTSKLNVQFDEEFLTAQFQLTEPNKIKYLYLRLGLAKLQSAITDEKSFTQIIRHEKPLITITHNNDNPTDFARSISKIEVDDDKNTIYFTVNNGAFAQTFQAYRVDGKPPIIASDLNGSFMINKQYLLKYLSDVFNGIVWCEKEKVPIVFDAKGPKSSGGIAFHDFNILIDTSTSMQPNFIPYIINIKAILDKLGKIPNWRIKIARFSSDSTERLFSLENGDTIDQVKQHVESFSASGSTRLYCTVAEALNDIRAKMRNAPELYSTLLVFTDGDDTVGGCTEEDVINAASVLKPIPRFNMYTVGFGQTDAGFQKFFKRMSDEGGFVHINLDDPSGMTELEQYINLLEEKINIWEMLQGELKMSVSRVPQGDAFVLRPGGINNIQGMTCVKNKDTFTFGTVCGSNNTPKPNSIVH